MHTETISYGSKDILEVACIAVLIDFKSNEQFGY